MKSEILFRQAGSELQPLEHELRWLARLHYVLAAITLAMAPVAAYIYYLGWDLLHDPAVQHRFDGPPLLDPLLWGAIWAMVGGMLATLSVVHAIALLYVGRCIARRRRRLFCLVFSIFDLTYAPLGTALGLFAIVLLSRPAVKAAFDASK